MTTILRLIAGPSAEPLTLAEAKAHLSVDGTAHDATIASCAAAAREHVELITGRRMMPQDWELRLPRFPDCGESLVLPYAPLIPYSGSADLISFVTVDKAGVSTAVPTTDYRVLAPTGPDAQRAEIVAIDTWPTTDHSVPDAVRVQWRCGYVSASAVPAALKTAMLLHLGDLFANREAASVAKVTDNPAFMRLVAPYRLP